MSSDLSTYLGNKIVRWLGGNAMPSAPATLYLALFNGNPKVSGVEVTTTIRAAGRLAVAWTVPAVGTDNEITTSLDADFGDADNDATLSYAALYDASTSGNLLASKLLPGGPFSVLAGSSVKFNAGNLTFTVGSGT
jgi:hypothetical protein